MARIAVTPDGAQHRFPDSATDAQIHATVPDAVLRVMTSTAPAENTRVGVVAAPNQNLGWARTATNAPPFILGQLGAKAGFGLGGVAGLASDGLAGMVPGAKLGELAGAWAGGATGEALVRPLRTAMGEGPSSYNLWNELQALNRAGNEQMVATATGRLLGPLLAKIGGGLERASLRLPKGERLAEQVAKDAALLHGEMSGEYIPPADLTSTMEQTRIPVGSVFGKGGSPAAARLVEQRAAVSGGLRAADVASGKTYTAPQLAQEIINRAEETGGPLTPRMKNRLAIRVRSLANDLLADQETAGFIRSKNKTFTADEVNLIQQAAWKASRGEITASAKGVNVAVAPSQARGVAQGARATLEGPAGIEGYGYSQDQLAQAIAYRNAVRNAQAAGFPLTVTIPQAFLGGGAAAAVHGGVGERAGAAALTMLAAKVAQSPAVQSRVGLALASPIAKEIAQLSPPTIAYLGSILFGLPHNALEPNVRKPVPLR